MRYIILGTLGAAVLVILSVFLLKQPAPAVRTNATPSEAFIAPDPLPNRPILSLGARAELEKTLRDYGQSQIAQGKLTKYSIFFRELNNGGTIAINANEDFSPASLLKVPIGLWYFKKEESTPGFLDNEVQITAPGGETIAHYPPAKSPEVGKTYTLRDLIAFMLQESDNNATTVLSEYAGGRDTINTVYTDLGIKNVMDFNTYVINVHTYASFFQSLYNAQYLNRKDSNELLSILSDSSFKAGLVAGVPVDVPLAHKFGERVIDANRNINQLHDCGIIYAKDAPYLLCVMTQGSDYDTLASFIASTSQRVYAAVSAQ